MAASTYSASGESDALVFAICHEVGNLVAAIRLNAHLIDDEASAVELAHVSVEIDDSSARIRSLLALVRPLLCVDPSADFRVRPGSVLRGVGDALDEIGARGVQVEVETKLGEALAEVVGESDVLHHLLLTLAFHALEEARPHGHVVVSASDSEDGFVIFSVADDGRDDPDLRRKPKGPATGRALACAVARTILGRLGGRVDAVRTAGDTRILLRLPKR